MKQKLSKSNRRLLLCSSKLLYSTIGSLLSLVLIFGLVLSSSYSYAVNGSSSESVNVSVIVNSACTITTGGGSYAKTISPGTTDIIPGNGINVTCNDSDGYALYAVGFSGDSYDTTNNNNTKMLAATDSNYIATGTSGNDSYWAMKAVGSSDIDTTPTIDNSFNNYHVIPATYTKISHYNGSTLGTTTNSVTTPSYQVHVATSQPANTYTGKVKYTLVHPSEVPTAQYMQNWTGCSSMAIGSETVLIDSRDNRPYRIVKFNDGKCWMAQNLDLPGGTQLSSTDTDFDSTYTLPTTNGWTVDSETNKLVMPESSTTGFSTDNYAYVYNSGKTATSDSDCTGTGCYSYYSWDTATVGSGRSIVADDTDTPYSICPKGWKLPNDRRNTNSTADFRKLMIVLGGSADIMTYDSNTNPTGATIFSGLSGNPLNYLRAGYYYGNTFYSGGSMGGYWSSTSASGTYACRLHFNSAYVGSDVGDSRRYGFSARCIADDHNYMQDVDSSQLAELMPNVGDTTTLYDKRDEQRYTVAKAQDGKYWMTKNLNIAGGTALTYQDTDMPEGYTLPTANGFQAGNKLPESISGTNTGDYSDNTTAYLTNSGSTTCASDSPCYSYYSWTTATLGSGLSITTGDTDAPYSICPKGWHLPNTRTGTNDTADFRRLMVALGGSASIEEYTSSTTPTGATIYNSLTSIPLNFSKAGRYSDGEFSAGGSGGRYWSATSYGSSNAGGLLFESSSVNPINSYARSLGRSIRCLFDN